MKFATVKFDINEGQLEDVVDLLDIELEIPYKEEFDEFQNCFVITADLENYEDVHRIYDLVISDLFPSMDFDEYVEAFVEGL